MRQSRISSWARVAFAMFAVGWGANQFSSMLVVYRHSLGLGPDAVAGLFAIYAAALVPGFLVGGPLSDRLGRRAVVLPFVILSPLSTLLIAADPRSLVAITTGRALGGLCSGTVFGAGTAWVQDLSGGDAASARRTALSLSAGFGLGPVAAALLAQWAPAPLVIPYLPHIVLGTAAVVALWPVPGRSPATGRAGAAGDAAAIGRADPAGQAGTAGQAGSIGRADAAGQAGTAGHAGSIGRDTGRDGVAACKGRGRSGSKAGWPPAGVRTGRFWLLIAPGAPAVFGTIALAIIVLPEETGLSPAATALVTVLAFTGGIGVQPLARRMEDRWPRSGVLAGLACTVAGAGISAAAVATASGAALADLAGIFFGLAYGLCLVSGLRQAEHVAGDNDRGAVIACYYVLAYLGFAAPYAAEALNTALGRPGTFGVLGALAAAAAALIAIGGVLTRRTDQVDGAIAPDPAALSPVSGE